MKYLWTTAACLFFLTSTAYFQTSDKTTAMNAPALRTVSVSKKETFEKELNELASQGFRLERVLESITISYLVAIMSHQQTEKSAGKYEYKLLAARDAATLQKELDAAATEGYEVRGLMSSGKMLISSEIILVLERLVGGKTQRFEYRILAAKNDQDVEFSNSMQKAASEGYRPIRVLHHFDVGAGVLVGAGKSAFLTILSRMAGSASGDDLEYKLLETVRNSTMENELNQAAKQGYRLFISSPSNALIVARDKKNHQPHYEYKILELKKKTEEDDLSNLSQQGFDYRAMYRTGAVLERDLQAGSNLLKHEYKLFKFPLKEEEKEMFRGEISKAIAAGFHFLDLTGAVRLEVLLVR